jgi:Na+/H+-translocating membrane pyrophosphatase
LKQSESVKEITDLLVGNTTKETTKAFSSGYVALNSFHFFCAYMDKMSYYAHQTFNHVDITIPYMFLGGLVGSMLIWCMEKLFRK